MRACVPVTFTARSTRFPIRWCHRHPCGIQQIDGILTSGGEEARTRGRAALRYAARACDRLDRGRWGSRRGVRAVCEGGLRARDPCRRGGTRWTIRTVPSPPRACGGYGTLRMREGRIRLHLTPTCTAAPLCTERAGWREHRRDRARRIADGGVRLANCGG